MSNVHDQLRTIEATARTLDATVAAHEAAFDPTVYMHADGSVVATGDMDLGGFDIDNVGDLGVGTVTPDRSLHVEEDSAATDTVTQVFRLTSTSSGTPANGIGVGMEFEVETTAGNEVGATIECVATDVSSGSEDFDLVFKTMVAGVSADPRLTLSATTSALMTHHGTAVGNGFDCNDAHIGTWIGSVNFAYFGHKAVKATAGSYSMLAQNDGATYLNAASTKLIDFRINNVTTMHMGANALHFPDLKGIYLGTGDDAAIYYSGTDLVVDPKVVGSGRVAIPGSLEVADGFATAGSSRNANMTVWSDNAFGMELSGIGGAPCLLLYGRATDTDAIKFGTYTANSTAQSNFTQRAVLTSAGGFGVGVSAPAAGKVDALGGFADNGTAGIDKTFSFSDGAFQTHSVIISGGIITQWNIA